MHVEIITIGSHNQTVDMNDLINTLQKCLQEEIDALTKVMESIDETSVDFAKVIADCKGKIIFTGVGKSLIVASKIAGTLSSIGIPSTSLNPLGLLHGDLGFLDAADLIVALSNSGETDILINALACARHLNIEILSITGNRASTIASISKVSIEIKTEEAGPFGLVPTSSTTAMMAFGDALACALVKLKGLTVNNFYNNHPNGELSKH